MKNIFRNGARIRYCAIAAAAAVCVSMFTQQALAVYSQSIAADFQANSGGSPFGGIPTSNPFGPNNEWKFFPPAGDVLITTPALPASGQPGWCDSNDGGLTCTSGGPYTYSANSFWQPGQTIHPGVMGHGPHDTSWTAPASIVLGNVSISGSLEQIFEPTREMRLSIYKNGAATPLFFLDALPPIVNGVILQPQNFGPIYVPIVPGDTLAIKVFPSGSPPPAQAGVPTFVNWNATITETDVPEPTSAMLVLIGGVGVFGFRRRK